MFKGADKRIYIALPILWAGVIYVLSSIPGPTLPAEPDVTPIIAHITEYAILGLLLIQAFAQYQKRFVVLDTIVLGLIWALSDEVHQLFVPGRQFDLMDIGFDFVGLLLGILIFYLTHRNRAVH